MEMNWTPPAFPTPSAGNSTKQPATTEFVAQAIGSSALTTFTDFISGLITAPTNQDYRIVEKLPFAITVTSFSAKTSTGTVTAALSINAAAITGGSLNASSTQTTVTPSALNTAAIGSALVLTGSATTGPANLSFTVVYTRSP
jgi:hypothetical protein